MSRISERESELPDAIIGRLIQYAVERKYIISLGPGEPDFPAPRPIVNYTKKIAAKCSHYSPPAGRRDLREAISKKLRKDNKIYTDPEKIIVTAGSQEGLMLALEAVLDINEEVILPNPTFLGYAPIIELLGSVVRDVKFSPENKWQPLPEDIEAKISKKTRAIILNTPSNPTGAVFSKKILEEIADIVVEHDLYLFNDEAYEKITYEAKHVSPASLNGLEDRVITLQTFSKSFAMAGYRIGYIVAPQDVAAAVKKIHVYSTISAPTISQMLAIKALELPSKYTDKMVREYRRRRNMIVKRLNAMGLETVKPKGTFYAFSSIRNHKKHGKDSLGFAEKILKDARVAVVPGSEFGCYGENFIRCSYATSYDLIEKAMDRIEKLLK